jgi:hypothetical protein
MKKIAIFVEGQTEQVFTDRLVRHIFGHSNVDVKFLQFSGKEGLRHIHILRLENITSSIKYLFYIYDCHGGGEKSTVKSDIVEQFPRLVKESFSYIIGIRDVHPLSSLDRLKIMMNTNLPNNPVLPVKIILAVREIEAWFLAEETHYPKISDRLSFEIANRIIGIDVSRDTTEDIKHPSNTLKQVYIEGGTTYDKSKKKVQRTVDAISYENLYINVRKRNNSLNELLTCLDGLIP